MTKCRQVGAAMLSVFSWVVLGLIGYAGYEAYACGCTGQALLPVLAIGLPAIAVFRGMRWALLRGPLAPAEAREGA